AGIGARVSVWGVARRATRSVFVHERAVADSDAVARVQRARAVEQLLVEVGAIRRAEILDHHDRALAHEPRVAGGREGILEMDLDVAAPERRAVLDVVLHAAVVAWHGLDDEP